MPDLSVPHGGTLVDRIAPPEQGGELAELAAGAPGVEIDHPRHLELELLATGAFSPLTGYLGRDAYYGVIEHQRLEGGELWSMPIVVPLADTEVDAATDGGPLALTVGGEAVGVIPQVELYDADKPVECAGVFGTDDPAHPGVARVLGQGSVYAGGDVWLLRRPVHDDAYAKHHYDPAQVREIAGERGWRTMVGFQTRNPIHRAHEYLTKCALESVDGLLIHPLVGATKEDDIPADVRMRCYEAVLGYYSSEHTLLGALSATMRYAGPKEALFHAMVRKNFGCTHFIVGRDHAGVGDYYGTYEAQEYLRSLPQEDLGVTPVFFEHTMYCVDTGEMASVKTMPEGAKTLHLSGTKVREMLHNGERPPAEFSRPEVADILIDAYRTADAGS